MSVSNRLCFLLGIVATLLSLSLYFYLCDKPITQKQSSTTEVLEISYDTLRYHHIKPVLVKADSLYLYINRDDSLSLPTPPPVVRDSIYTFRDTIDGRWSAEISGERISLRELTIIDRGERLHTTIKSYTPPVWEVALKGGMTPNAQWFGVGVSHNIGRFCITLDAGYDQWSRTPRVALSASFAIFRRY